MWSLLVGCAASAYISWMREQRALERFAEQLGPAGERQLRCLRAQHPLWSPHRPVSVSGLLGLRCCGAAACAGCRHLGGNAQAGFFCLCPAHLQPHACPMPICKCHAHFS